MLALGVVLGVIVAVIVIAVVATSLRDGGIAGAYEQLKARAQEVAVVAAALEHAETVALEWERDGYTSGFRSFNSELIRPLKRMPRDYAANPAGLCLDVCSTLSLRPSAPKVSFIFWNVCCFWVGAIDVVLVLAFEHGFSWVSSTVAIFDGLLGYLFAYACHLLRSSGGASRRPEPEPEPELEPEPEPEPEPDAEPGTPSTSSSSSRCGGASSGCASGSSSSACMCSRRRCSRGMRRAGPAISRPSPVRRAARHVLTTPLARVEADGRPP